MSAFDRDKSLLAVFTTPEDEQREVYEEFTDGVVGHKMRMFSTDNARKFLPSANLLARVLRDRDFIRRITCRIALRKFGGRVKMIQRVFRRSIARRNFVLTRALRLFLLRAPASTPQDPLDLDLLQSLIVEHYRTYRQQVKLPTIRRELASANEDEEETTSGALAKRTENLLLKALFQGYWTTSDSKYRRPGVERDDTDEDVADANTSSRRPSQQLVGNDAQQHDEVDGAVMLLIRRFRERSHTKFFEDCNALIQESLEKRNIAKRTSESVRRLNSVAGPSGELSFGAFDGEETLGEFIPMGIAAYRCSAPTHYTSGIDLRAPLQTIAIELPAWTLDVDRYAKARVQRGEAAERAQRTIEESLKPAPPSPVKRRKSVDPKLGRVVEEVIEDTSSSLPKPTHAVLALRELIGGGERKLNVMKGLQYIRRRQRYQREQRAAKKKEQSPNSSITSPKRGLKNASFASFRSALSDSTGNSLDTTPNQSPKYTAMKKRASGKSLRFSTVTSEYPDPVIPTAEASEGENSSSDGEQQQRFSLSRESSVGFSFRSMDSDHVPPPPLKKQTTMPAGAFGSTFVAFPLESAAQHKEEERRRTSLQRKETLKDFIYRRRGRPKTEEEQKAELRSQMHAERTETREQKLWREHEETMQERSMSTPPQRVDPAVAARRESTRRKSVAVQQLEDTEFESRSLGSASKFFKAFVSSTGDAKAVLQQLLAEEERRDSASELQIAFQRTVAERKLLEESQRRSSSPHRGTGTWRRKTVVAFNLDTEALESRSGDTLLSQRRRSSAASPMLEDSLGATIGPLGAPFSKAPRMGRRSTMAVEALKLQKKQPLRMEKKEKVEPKPKEENAAEPVVEKLCSGRTEITDIEVLSIGNDITSMLRRVDARGDRYIEVTFTPKRLLLEQTSEEKASAERHAHHPEFPMTPTGKSDAKVMSLSEMVRQRSIQRMPLRSVIEALAELQDGDVSRFVHDVERKVESAESQLNKEFAKFNEDLRIAVQQLGNTTDDLQGPSSPLASAQGSPRLMSARLGSSPPTSSRISLVSPKSQKVQLHPKAIASRVADKSRRVAPCGARPTSAQFIRCLAGSNSKPVRRGRLPARSVVVSSVEEEKEFYSQLFQHFDIIQKKHHPLRAASSLT